jgi:hypothetical protein
VCGLENHLFYELTNLRRIEVCLDCLGKCFALPFALNKFDPQVFGLWGKYCCAKHLMDILPNKKVVDIDLFFWSHHKFSQV